MLRAISPLLHGRPATAKEMAMASNAYLRLKGQKQGTLKGSVTQKGHVSNIMVIATRHEISSPRDAASGRAAGKRTHGRLIITKELDQSTPLLYNALVNNETLTEWELQFWRATAVGAEEHYYTIKLTSATVVSIEFVQPNTKNPELAKYPDYENVAFTYQKIEWTWVKGGISAVDDWHAPTG
jgi:type VI secretion system secreted protein Hcp